MLIFLPGYYEKRWKKERRFRKKLEDHHDGSNTGRNTPHLKHQSQQPQPHDLHVHHSHQSNNNHHHNQQQRQSESPAKSDMSQSSGSAKCSSENPKSTTPNTNGSVKGDSTDR